MGKTFKFDDELEYMAACSNKDTRRANFRRRLEEDRRKDTWADMNIGVPNYNRSGLLVPEING